MRAACPPRGEPKSYSLCLKLVRHEKKHWRILSLLVAICALLVAQFTLGDEGSHHFLSANEPHRGPILHKKAPGNQTASSTEVRHLGSLSLHDAMAAAWADSQDPVPEDLLILASSPDGLDLHGSPNDSVAPNNPPSAGSGGLNPSSQTSSSRDNRLSGTVATYFAFEPGHGSAEGLSLYFLTETEIGAAETTVGRSGTEPGLGSSAPTAMPDSPALFNGDQTAENQSLLWVTGPSPLPYPDIGSEATPPALGVRANQLSAGQSVAKLTDVPEPASLALYAGELLTALFCFRRRQAAF